MHSRQNSLVKNCIFIRCRVIAPTAAMGNESAFFIELSGRQIGLANLQENHFGRFLLTESEKFIEQLFSESLPPHRLSHYEILDFPFPVEDAGDEERLHRRSLLDNQRHPARG